MRRGHEFSDEPLLIVTIAMIFAIACTDAAQPVSPLDESTRQTRNTGPSYTATNLGALPGDNSSRANGVNDAGEAVGYSCCSVGNRAFIRLSGSLTALAGDNGDALAVSNGVTRYVVGWAGSPSQPVKWSVAGNTPGQPAYLSTGTATSGAALGVNDAGEAVGKVGDDAAMWDGSGNLSLVAAPQGFVRGESRGIDNAGHAVFVFFRPDPSWPDGIAVGYLRLVTGETIELPPAVSSGISYANNLSEVSGNVVFVAGSSYSTPSTPSAVRWTVDVVQKQIVATEMRSETSHATAVSDGGIAAGFVEGNSHSLSSTAFRWQGSQLLSLNPPKGGKEGKAWAISPKGNFVAGEAVVQSRTAALWSF